MRHLIAVLLPLLLTSSVAAQTAAGTRPRARDLALSAVIGGTPGPLDAITDVAGVEVGHATLIAGSGKLVRGMGPVRTGVTAVFPRGRRSPAAWWSAPTCSCRTSVPA